MGTREKARQFLETSKSHEHYSTTVEYILAYFIAKAEKEGNDRFVADLKKAREEYHEDFQHAIEVTETVTAETFSDEELDDLIVLHSNPAIEKSRALAADIVNEILEKYLEMSK